MDAKVCDRCFETYPVNVDIFYDYTILKNAGPFDGRKARHMDLCDKCAKALDEFMHTVRPIGSVGRR